MEVKNKSGNMQVRGIIEQEDHKVEFENGKASGWYVWCFFQKRIMIKKHIIRFYDK